MDKHPGIKAFVEKIQKDNISMLAGYLSWSVLTSLAPIIVGLVAISSLFLRSPSIQQQVIVHVADATQGALTRQDVARAVKASTEHAGLLGLVGFLGFLWGGSHIGGALSTSFQAIFEVDGRPYLKEKLIDVVMIVVFTILMIVIILGTSAGAILSRLVAGFPLPDLAQAVGIVVGLVAAFLLFATIYLVFPNIRPRFRLRNVWRGALTSAVLFEILSLVWPLYAALAHFGRYGRLFVPILILTAWIYLFSLIVTVGAEVVAISAIRESQAKDEPVGPEPKETVPQHSVMRG